MKTIDTLIGPVSETDLNKWELVIHYMEPIISYFIDPDITEIMINRFDTIFIEGLNGFLKTEATFGSEANLQRFIRQLSIVLNQDQENLSILHARFPDQSRACCTLIDVSPSGSTVTIRCTSKKQLSFKDLIALNALTPAMSDFLKQRIQAKDNFMVIGSSGSGKTTLLRALAAFISPEERVLVCEDTQELLLKLPNQISLEAPDRKDNDITLSTLIETTLRQRPDRVFVGEIRDAFACDAFLQVINTGHGGCGTSIHANNCRKALHRIQYLMAKEGLIDFEMAGQELKESIHLLIHVKRTPHGKRITDISVLDKAGNIQQVFGYDEETDQHSDIKSNYYESPWEKNKCL